MNLPGLPSLRWTGDPGQASYDFDADALTLQSAAGVDWTNDAGGGPQQHAATALAFTVPKGDFVLSARVRVEGSRTRFDAGALALWADKDHWAKLCNEFSPMQTAMVVSVVTDRFSDDCSSTLVDGPAVSLRIARVGESIALHSSADSTHWDFVRTFRLPTTTEEWSAGFLAQSPTGAGCVAVFDEIRFEEATVLDLRDGS